jgi:hypothetical protein
MSRNTSTAKFICAWKLGNARKMRTSRRSRSIRKNSRLLDCLQSAARAALSLA